MPRGRPLTLYVASSHWPFDFGLGSVRNHRQGTEFGAEVHVHPRDVVQTDQGGNVAFDAVRVRGDNWSAVCHRFSVFEDTGYHCLVPARLRVATNSSHLFRPL